MTVVWVDCRCFLSFVFLSGTFLRVTPILTTTAELCQSTLDKRTTVYMPATEEKGTTPPFPPGSPLPFSLQLQPLHGRWVWVGRTGGQFPTWAVTVTDHPSLMGRCGKHNSTSQTINIVNC